ncbi:ceramidase domain-containing protein [Candidatus Methylobacter oryzae]|uniref:Ceramidase n=1 Tax=Candidatus Methylobacter oryzae TaxID=2497749 RepID=A0ABY3CM21_9GAMM|nr:ceramidase domain-containing protein [Candidatus Methylobacter oryzae]TRX03007.1 ceramidase [Candidatus Methylobacter oryzae]
MPTDNRLRIMLAVIVAAIIAVFNVDPIAQNPAYHDFADQRRIFNIDNFFNVLTNLPLVIAGIIGIRLVASGQARGGLAELKTMYLAFFIGVFLSGLGSAYYHYQPDNQTLFWDRLPMTIIFMALFAVIIGEYISTQLARKLFVPLLILGITSVVYWQITELNGHGDLRAYGLVQFLPVLLIPLILRLFDSKLDNDKSIWGVLGIYALAKLMELLDIQIYNIAGFSGHSLKHLTVAFAALIFYWALQERTTTKKD